ncbi:MAG: glycosyltransferase, partial [Oscillospiraceae bacterium]|nr:glycosyltransferase [Oscillospiraceae bacterium]
SEKKAQFEKLKQEHNNFNIELLNMGEQFKEFRDPRFSEVCFYMFKIFSLLPQGLDKCIYLDCDTLILKDLKELYDFDLGDNYVAGVPDIIRLGKFYGAPDPERYTFEVQTLDHYVNSGVLLWNLDKCRKDNIEERLISFLTEKWNGHFHDQCVINAVCYPKIIDLPFKFNAQTYFFGLDAEYGKGLSDTSCFSKEDWDEGRSDPTVVHFCEFKPWRKPQIYAKEWWQTAKRSPFLQEILRKYLYKLPSDYDQRLVRGFLTDDKSTTMTTETAPLVSVIIPVYNVENYLERCLRSVLGQTLKNIEIICINDKSTDNSLRILKEFEREDKRIKVIDRKINGGASLARNDGLAVARGEYIGFVDSDDWIDPKTYEIAYRNAKKFDVEVVMWGAWCDERPTSEHYSGPKADAVYNNIMGLALFFPPAGSSMVWDKLYKRDLLEKTGVKFDPYLPCTQDTLFNFTLCPHVTKFLTLRNPLYHYKRKMGGLVKSMEQATILSEIKAVCISLTSNWPARVPPELAQILCDGAIGWLLNHSKWAGAFADCDTHEREEIVKQGTQRLKDWFAQQVMQEDFAPVCVVLPFHNAESWLETNSGVFFKFLSETPKNVEVLLINNGSIDDTDKELISLWGHAESERIHFVNLNTHISSLRRLKTMSSQHARDSLIVFVDAKQGALECFCNATGERNLPLTSLSCAIQEPIRELIISMLKITKKSEKLSLTQKAKSKLEEINQWDGDAF